MATGTPARPSGAAEVGDVGQATRTPTGCGEDGGAPGRAWAEG